MSITFRCEKCRKNVQAPDSAAGKRGKCPHCGQSSYIPKAVADEDLIPLAPIDEAEEQARKKEIDSLLAVDRQLLHETGSWPDVPLEHKEDLSSADLHHFVVNYCMDVFDGNLERAQLHVRKMKMLKYTAIEAVEDFQTKKAKEPTLDRIPSRVLEGLLKDLKAKLKE